MTRQNRVLPTGDIIAHPARGSLMGNRGILHDAEGRLGRARWRHKAWITCLLQFKGRHRSVMSPNSYTELFFLDEAVALAAGHRPCAECRRSAYIRFLDCWQAAHGSRPKAAQIDYILHSARIDPRSRRQRTSCFDCSKLPDGTFIWHRDQAHMIVGNILLPFACNGYGQPEPRPDRPVTVLTPHPIIGVMQAGYRPALHETVRAH